LPTVPPRVVGDVGAPSEARGNLPKQGSYNKAHMAAALTGALGSRGLQKEEEEGEEEEK
jgi:hypothetical protein